MRCRLRPATRSNCGLRWQTTDALVLAVTSQTQHGKPAPRRECGARLRLGAEWPGLMIVDQLAEKSMSIVPRSTKSW